MKIINLDTPIKIKNKILRKFKHELGSREIEEFRVLKPKNYRFKNVTSKEKRIKRENNCKHEDYYNALMDNKERIVEECRIPKVGDKMSTIKTNKRSLNNFDDKRFCVSNIKSYPHDENLCLFKRDLVNNFNAASVKLLRRSLDLDKDQMANNILKLTINDDRELIEAAI